MSPAKVATLSNAVLAACDADDGISDGVVANPAACSFDASALRCAGGADTGDSCLSDPQLAAVASWTSDTTLVGGTYRNAGWPLSGNESAAGAWDNWVTGIAGGPSLQFLFQDTTVKYYLARDPAANSLTYDFESNPGALFALEALNSATNANLMPFLGAGGRLILWHGGNDSALSVNTTTEFVQQVTSAMGGTANAEQFMRYYVAPGVNHCAGGPGADSADLLSALDAWVTRGRAPRTLTAYKLDPTTGATLFERPLCRHPEFPRYIGRGDPNARSSYRCTAP
jgi:feruloyl esterase